MPCPRHGEQHRPTLGRPTATWPNAKTHPIWISRTSISTEPVDMDTPPLRMNGVRRSSDFRTPSAASATTAAQGTVRQSSGESHNDRQKQLTQKPSHTPQATHPHGDTQRPRPQRLPAPVTRPHISQVQTTATTASRQRTKARPPDKHRHNFSPPDQRKRLRRVGQPSLCAPAAHAPLKTSTVVSAASPGERICVVQVEDR